MNAAPPIPAIAKLGATLKEVRTRLSLTIEQLSKESGVPMGSISEIENAKTLNPTIDTLGRLAGTLELSIPELFGHAGKPIGEMIPIAAIDPSPLNPRRTFDEAAIAELADSIAAKGLLEPLLVRRASPDSIRSHVYHIVAGERRWRAMVSLIEDGRWPEDTLPGHNVPCIVRDIDDAEHVLLALIENIQREDLPPMELAEALARAHEIDPETWSAKALAETLGRKPRYVQQRLKLVRDLAEDAKAALAKGEITFESARLLSQAAPEAQAEVIEAMANGYMYDLVDIRAHLFGDLPQVDWALFAPAKYDGEIIEDDDDPEDRRFADRSQFSQLQMEAVEALKAKLEKSWAWVEIQMASYPELHHYGRADDPKIAGVVIHVTPRGEVRQHEGMVRAEDKPEAETGDTGAPAAAQAASGKAPAYTRANLINAHQCKTRALQRAVAGDVSARAAKILVCLAMLGHTQNILIRKEWPFSRDDRVVDDSVDKTVEAYQKSVDHLDNYSSDPNRPIESYAHLSSLNDADLNSLFAALVGAQVGTFSGRFPVQDDTPVAVALAGDLGIDMAAHFRLDTDYLKSLRKTALAGLMVAAGDLDDEETLRRQPKPKLIERAENLVDILNVIPPEIQFGSKAEFEAAAEAQEGDAETA